MKLKTTFLLSILILLLVSGCSLRIATKAPAAEPMSTTAPVIQPTYTTEPTDEPIGSALAPADASALPPADIANNEGGAEIITGEWSYTSYTVASHYEEPVVALLNISKYVAGDYSAWVPRTSQILGTLTSPLAPPPVTYRIPVPVHLPGDYVDVDNNGEEDKGVQVYVVVIGPNLANDSYLEQMEQFGYGSYLTDPQTGVFREGSVLVYAPDDEQGFPNGTGEDGQIFTADDPVVGLPAGYTLATLSSDGQVSFDRSREGTMDTLEAASMASPDFSKQSILESFNSLIDLLSVRYSYSDLRGLNWEEIRQTYLPKVEEADKANDMGSFFAVLFRLALQIKDAHVYPSATNGSTRQAGVDIVGELYRANLGASGVELESGQFIINFLDPNGPAAKAGWQFGTEILSVDGVPIKERISSIPLFMIESTPEGIRMAQAEWALRFPEGAETTIEYRQSDGGEVLKVVLTAESGFETRAPDVTDHFEDISFMELDGGYGYIQWRGFSDPLYKIMILERFLNKFLGAQGIVIDLRGNTGGSGELYNTMASYFFTEENPASYHWIDFYTYDDKVNGLVKEFSYDAPLYAPKSNLAYQGAVVVLVDHKTGSAGEYFPQLLQYMERAKVVGERGTAGAGGAVELVTLPGGITFHFTKGRNYYAGTEELNLEGKGVTLDVRVPITLENEQAKQEGRDPVLEVALGVLAEESSKIASSRIVGTTWKLGKYFEASGGQIGIENPEIYMITFGEEGALSITADCNQVNGSYSFGTEGTVTITLGTTTLAACPEGSLSEQFLQWLAATTSLETDGSSLALNTDPESGVLALLFELSN